VGFGFLPTPLQVRDHAFELVLAHEAGAAFAEIAEFDFFLAGAEQDRVAGLLRQLAPRRFHVELVVLRQRPDHLEEVRIATVPAAHRAFAEAALGMRDHARRIEELRSTTSSTWK